MKKYYKKIVFFLFATLLAFVTLSTSTLAWFSISQINYLDNLELNIKSDVKMQISLDGQNYYDSINKQMIEEAIGKNIILDDVTTTDGINFESLKEGSPKRYLSFNLYFKADFEVADNLYLVDNYSKKYTYDYVKEHEINGTYIISKGVTWTNPVSFNNGGEKELPKFSTNTYYASDAMRIGIRELNVNNEYLNNPDERTNEELASLIFDPSEDNTRGYAALIGAYDYYKNYNDVTLPLPPIYPNTKYKLSTLLSNGKMDNDDSKIATFRLGKENNTMYKYASIKVSIWLEGWDADCFDSILGDEAIIQLKFMSA